MNSKSSIAPFSILFITFFLLFSTATCFNITKILNSYPDFSNFNSYLTQTQLADVINNRQTITVLAVANSAMGSLSGKSNDMIKKVMSLHVVLDYYDPSKLQKLSNKTALLTTLFQSTSMAVGQQGFVNATDTDSGVSFGSAVEGSSLNANLVKSIAAQPYNISVLQISALIIPTGLSNSTSNSTHSPPPSDAPAPAPKKSPKTKAKAPKSADSPPAPSPADGPATDGPVADGPVADGPKADAPAADAPDADASDADASKTESGRRVTSATFVSAFIMVVVSSWFAAH